MKKAQIIYITLSIILVLLSLIWFFKDKVFKKELGHPKSDRGLNLNGDALDTHSKQDAPRPIVDTDWEEVPTTKEPLKAMPLAQPQVIRPTTIELQEWNHTTKQFSYTIVHGGQLVRGQFAPGAPPIDQPIAGGRLLVVQGLLPPKELVDAAIQPDGAPQKGKLNINLSKQQKVAVVTSNQYASHSANQPLLDQLSALHQDFGGVLSEFVLILVFDAPTMTQETLKVVRVLDFDDGSLKRLT